MFSSRCRLWWLLVSSKVALSSTLPLRSIAAHKWLEDSFGALREGPIVGDEHSSYAQYSTEGSGVTYGVQAWARGLTEGTQGEALSLQAIAATGSVRVPALVHVDGSSPDGSGSPESGGSPNHSFLITEHLSDGTRLGVEHAEALGVRMAHLHLAPPAHSPSAFGFSVPTEAFGGRSTSLQEGSGPVGGGASSLETNEWTDDWVVFFRENRINHQMYIAQQRQTIPALDYYVAEEWNGLMEATGQLRAFFQGLRVTPSLLHGSFHPLNVALVHDEPALFRPASYYGHHEAEFAHALSQCEQGPDRSFDESFWEGFWRGYRKHIPEDAGFGARQLLYALHSQLALYNAWGFSDEGEQYGNQALQTIRRLRRIFDRRRRRMEENGGEGGGWRGGGLRRRAAEDASADDNLKSELEAKLEAEMEAIFSARPESERDAFLKRILPKFELCGPEPVADEDAGEDAADDAHEANPPQCGEEERPSRRIEEVSPAAVTRKQWHREWRRRLECWYLTLPPLSQSSLGSCIGALSLHVGSKLDLAWRAAASAAGGPELPPPRPTQAVAPGCEWFEEGAAASLPEFPHFGRHGTPGGQDLHDLTFSLPPIPRLLLPSWERLHSLERMQQRRHELARDADARERLPTSIGAVGAGAAAGASFALLIMALSRASREKSPWRR